MKTTVMSVLCAIILLVACNKKEPQPGQKTITPDPPTCGHEIVLAKEMKVKELDIVLPPATRICIANDSSEITMLLPTGYSYVVDGRAYNASPVIYATYHCLCSGGGACTVLWGDELGFGCLHNNCIGGCTGQFTYKGYTANKVVNLMQDKEKVFEDPEVQKEIVEQVERLYNDNDISPLGKSPGVYVKQQLYGLSYYVLMPKKVLNIDNGLELFDPAKVSCDCEGTKACILKTKLLQLDKTGDSNFKIYYCDGPCNGCELTVN